MRKKTEKNYVGLEEKQGNSRCFQNSKMIANAQTKKQLRHRKKNHN